MFATGVILFSGLDNSRGVELTDLDGDDDLDLVIGVTNGSGLYWAENLDGNGNYGSLTNLDPTLTQARLQLVADIDGDDDLDIVSNGIAPYITWYENTDGQGTFSTRMVIDPTGLYHNSMTIVDFDLDDDPDILASVDEDKIILFENDGTGVFALPIVINDQIDNPNSMIAVDVDNDLDLDIVCQSGANEVIYLINEDGLGSFGNIQFVDDNLPLPRDVAAGDIDGDGDQDIVTAALEPATGGDRSLVWYENRTILGVTGFDLAGVSMTPNPAKDTLTIISENYAVLEVTIYQLQGQELLQLQEDFEQIDVSNLATGIYLVNIVTTQGKAIKKLVKE